LEGLNSIVGIPYFYLFDPPKSNVINGYDLNNWTYIQSQDRVALIKSFIDEVSTINGVTGIYWSVELAGVPLPPDDYQHLNYALAKDLKDYSEARGLFLLHIIGGGGTNSPIYYTRSEGNFSIMGGNAHEIYGDGRYIERLKWVTNKSILNTTESYYNFEVRGNFQTAPRNTSDNYPINKSDMLNSLNLQIAAAKQYKPQHVSLYHYGLISPYHTAGILYPESRAAITDYLQNYR